MHKWLQKGKGIKGGYQNNMLKFDEQKQIDSVKGALALRGKIEEIVDQICKDGFKNICWLGIGGTYASCLQAEVHMKEKSGLDFFVENAAEYLTTGNKKVGVGTIVGFIRNRKYHRDGGRCQKSFCSGSKGAWIY